MDSDGQNNTVLLIAQLHTKANLKALSKYGKSNDDKEYEENPRRNEWEMSLRIFKKRFRKNGLLNQKSTGGKEQEE